MKQFFVLITGIATLFGTAAVAADLSRKPAAAYKAPAAAPPPIFSWTGCYLGGHVGGGWGRSTYGDQVFGLTLPGQTFTDNTSGWLAGGQIGCNYQFSSSWVIGAEGSLSGSEIKGSVNDPFFFVPPAVFTAKTDWLASVTGRLGYTWDRVLFYAKGGVAWDHNKYNVPGLAGGTTFNDVFSDSRSGWTVGGGVEWAFWQNWSVRVEYDFYGFGTKGVTLVDSTGHFPPFAGQIKQDIQTVTVGVNYRFGPY